MGIFAIFVFSQSTATALLKFLKKIWRKFRGIFIKRPPSTEKIISEEKAVLEQLVNRNEIFTQIAESENENERAGLINLIAKQKTAESIIEFVEHDLQKIIANKKGRKRLYELHELRTELLILEERRVVLDYTDSTILVADYPDTSSIERRVDSLKILLDKNKSDDKIELSKISVSSFDKSFQQLENLINYKSALIKHNNRESEKQRQEKIYENKIDKELKRLETLLNQNDFAESKSLINVLSHSIKPNYKKGQKKLNQSITKLKEKELQKYTSQQEELLKNQAEQAKILMEKDEKRFTELKIKRDQEAIQKKEEEEKLYAKTKRLKALLNKKANWRDFQKVLQENGIKGFYHFTDQSNLKSIKQNGGLFSWFYCDLNNIVIPMPGGSLGSRQNDSTNRKKDFVRLAFNKEHPMLFIAENDGRISNAIWLNIDIEVAYFENTEFSDKNAAAFSSYKPIIGKEVINLENVRFKVLKKAQRVKHYNLHDDEKPFNQAEVLVKTWIPLEHITNINTFA